MMNTKRAKRKKSQRAQRHKKLSRIRNIMRAKSISGVAAVLEFLENPQDAKLLDEVVTRHYTRGLAVSDNDVLKDNRNGR